MKQLFLLSNFSQNIWALNSKTKIFFYFFFSFYRICTNNMFIVPHYKLNINKN